MKIAVKCECGNTFYVPMTEGEKKQKCPQCQQEKVIPKLSSNKSSPVSNQEIRPLESRYKRVVARLGKVSLTTGLVISHLLFLVYVAILIWERESGIVPLPEEKIATSIFQDFQNIQKLPEQSPQEMKSKISAWQNFLAQHGGGVFLTALNEKNKLLQKFQWQKHYQKLQHTEFASPIDKWWHWYELQQQFPQAQLSTQDKEEIKKLESKMLAFINLQTSEIQQLLEEQRYHEIINRVTPKLLSYLTRESPLPARVQQALQELHRVFEKADKMSAVSQMDDPGVIPAELQIYRKNFQQYLTKFYKMMYRREYEKVEKDLEKFWQKINSIPSLHPDHPLLKTIHRKLQDVQALKSFFAIANEGAKDTIGTNKPLFPRQGRVILGKITNFVLGVFVVETEQGESLQVPLRQLRAEEVLFFALKQQKNRYTYQYAGIFFCYEREFELARKAFNEALVYGTEPQEIEPYLHWLEKLDKFPKKPK